MLKRKDLNRAVMVSALADWGHSGHAAVCVQHRHASANHYKNNSCLRTTGGRKGTFLLTRTGGHAVNRGQWRAVA